MCDRLIHDAAWAAAHRLAEIVAPCLREEEQAELFHEFYCVARAAIEAYEVQLARDARRLGPSSN